MHAQKVIKFQTLKLWSKFDGLCVPFCQTRSHIIRFYEELFFDELIQRKCTHTIGPGEQLEKSSDSCSFKAAISPTFQTHLRF